MWKSSKILERRIPREIERKMTSRKVQKRISELVNPSKASNEEFAEKKKRER